MQVNTMSHFWTTKAFLPSMIEKDHGQIVSIASSAGYFAVPHLAEYCASKAAAAHFADVSEFLIFFKLIIYEFRGVTICVNTFYAPLMKFSTTKVSH